MGVAECGAANARSRLRAHFSDCMTVLHRENRKRVEALFDPPEPETAEKFREDVHKLHREISVFLRVMKSRRKVS